MTEFCHSNPNRSRAKTPCTLVDENQESGVLKLLFPQTFEFKGDAVLSMVEPCLYHKGLKVRSTGSSTPNES